MTRFNLSEWAVHNRAIVVFLMLVCVIGGVSAYERLGRQEDPDFTVQTMVVQAVWPGATAADTLKQVTDRLEKKLEETPNLDYIKSYTKPGQATIFVYLKESTPKRDLNDIWYQVRKKVSDIKATLPQGVVGPFFNDEFGDVFGIIYGITYDGFTRARGTRLRRDRAGRVPARRPTSARSTSYGDQDEKVYLNFSPQKLANLKLSLDDVLTAIARQNAVVPSGIINTPNENMLVDVTGSLLSPDGIANLNLWVDGRFYKLSDIAEVQRGYSDPPTKMFRVNGKPAIGIGVNMREGGNNLDFGKGLHEAAERLKQRFPVGIELNLVSDQPEVVREAIGGFTEALVRGDRHRARGQLPQPGLQGRARGRPVHPARARHRFRGHGSDGHQPAAHLPRRAHHRARASRRRRHDHHRDDDLEDRGRHGKDQGGNLRLYLHRLPDADGNADHDPRLPADRLRRQQHRTVLLLAVCRDRGGARRLVVRGRHLRAGDRAFAPAVAHEEGARDHRAGPLHARFRTPARLRHAAPLAHHRRSDPCLRRLRSTAWASCSSSSSRPPTGRSSS